MLENHSEKSFCDRVSIPSNGSIQFLYEHCPLCGKRRIIVSQSPLTGQFNFYIEHCYYYDILNALCLNPL